MNSKDLLYSTEKYIQYLVINTNGKESEKSIRKSCTTERQYPKGQGPEMISKTWLLPSRSIESSGGGRYSQTPHMVQSTDTVMDK